MYSQTQTEYQSQVIYVTTFLAILASSSDWEPHYAPTTSPAEIRYYCQWKFPFFIGVTPPNSDPVKEHI